MGDGEDQGFRELLFGRVAAEDLLAVPEGAQRRLAEEALKAMRRRKPGKPLIQLRDAAADGLPGVMILEAINDDRPFLLDSTLEELRERGISPRLVAHPILAVERGTDGGLKETPTLPGPSARGARESLIHIHLPALGAGEAAELKAGLAKVYADVAEAVDDFAAMRKRLSAIVEDYRRAPPPAPPGELDEALAFLDWIIADHMTLLGMREYRLTADVVAPEQVQGSGLGILRDPAVNVLRRGRSELAMTPEILAFLRDPQVLIVTKANVKSRVHRRVHMDYVGVKLYDSKGQVAGELRVVGLFTATVYNDPVTSVPYIRRKAEATTRKAGFPPGSYSARALANVLETFPRDELFQISQEQLDAFAIDIMALGDRPRIRALTRVDRFDRFASILVYVPKDRYDSVVRRRIGEYLAKAYQGRVSAAYPAYLEGPLVRTHYIIGRDEGPTPAVSRTEVETAVAAIVRTWADDLRDLAVGDPAAEKLIRRHADRFGASYRESFDVAAAVVDMETIDRLSPERPRLVDLYRKAGDPPERAALKVFQRGEAVTLSERVPLLEGLGFRVVSERTYRLDPPADPTADGDVVWLHDMALERAAGGPIDIDDIEPRIEAALMALFRGSTESDHLNALIMEAGAGWREVAMLRAFSRYIQQIGAPYDQGYIAETLKKHSGAGARLVDLFHARFDPRIEDGERQARQDEAFGRVEEALASVASLDEDRILRLFRSLMMAAVRTNFYQLGPDGRPRDVIAFKFDAAKIPNLPLPKPMFEIFLHSPRVEGVHMRFGKVARGGIRWSDRPQDFRTEILGLVKAQQVKNAVIVPVGAKGGFVPKKLPPASDRVAWLAEGTEAYKLFIGTLLTLTDNLKDGEVVPPADTVRHDADDPYLVVAADKGTATFSDAANAISEAHGHWLGDAFASGGSAGYDHKKMGITARGAWEAVKRHFREMDVDIQTTPFTVAGVGDMSGDVFGNGMLLSRKIRLVAAFDHRDIFIDPAPDEEASFAERQRLFALPRSSWRDYDPALISRGGGVFSRAAKEIPLSAEMRTLLDLEGETATPQQVMNAILKARVDLLWFGGIGTYVRASSETNADVGDRANDAIRVAGRELRCRVIGEGANLGATQRGRIEAAAHGVRLNTDAIDNSAGVNSSDVEVNIKIALSKPMSDGRLTLETRNPLLASMTDDVARLVLRNNYLQTLAISLAERRGAVDVADARRLMQALEREGRLDRDVEFLPSDAELDERERQGRGLTRPEIAVLLAYAKLAFHDAVLASDVPDDPYFAVELRRYFPDKVRDGYPDAVDGHRLRREIIATALANAVINRTGPALAARMAEDAGRPLHDVARAYALTRDAFGVLEVNTANDGLDARIPGALQLELYAAVQQFTLDRMAWFLRHVDFSVGLDALVRRFAAPALAGDPEPWLKQGAPADIARRIADLLAGAGQPDAVLIAEAADVDAGTAALVAGEVAAIVRASDVRRMIGEIEPDGAVERQALMRLAYGLDGTVRRLAVEALSAGGATDWAEARAQPIERARRVVDDMLQGAPSLAKATVAASALADLPAA